MGIKYTQDLPILIAGAGPAGLALAQQLRKRKIPFRVFDRDNNVDSRGQGWAVALQWVIPELRASIPDDLPPVEFVSHLYKQNIPTELAAYVGNGYEIFRKEQGDDFLRADRLRLRQWLGTHIEVEWNKKLVKFTESEGVVEAEFKDGTKAKGCALVGAEGGHSSVRAQLVTNSALHDPPFDSALGNLTLSRKEYEAAFKSLARSVVVLQHEEVFLFIGLHEIIDDGENAKWYWMVVKPHEESGVSTTDNQPSEVLHQHALKWIEPLPEKFKSFVQKTKPENCLAMTPFIQVWSPPDGGFSTGRVTLVGDAAHKTTPLGGVGVNHAIQDTFDLVGALDAKDSISAALGEYDKMVTERGQEAIRKCTTWPFLRGGQ